MARVTHPIARPLLLGALIAAALSLPATADTVIKIGNIIALTGDGAATGQHIQQGEALFQKLHDKDLPPGVKVELVTRDDASKPDNTKRLAQEVIVRDHVQMIAGIAMSPQGFAVAPVLTEAKIPGIFMNATTGSLTRSSPYIVRFSHSNWHMAYSIGEWAAKHGIKTAYSVVADYAAGLDMEAAFKQGLVDNGSALIGSDHTPLSTTDYLPAMQRVKAAKPQALFFFVVPGTGTIAFDKAYADADLAAAGVQLIGTGDVVPDDELEQVGPSINGMLNASLYSNDLKNPANEALLKAWHTEYGPTAVPSFESIAAWNGMGAIYSVVKQLGANATGDAALALLRTYKDPATPQGPIAIDPDTRDIICDVYLGKISKVDGHWANVPFDVIKNVKDHWKIINPPS